MYIADTLSRATASREGEDINENPCDERVVYALEATDSLSEENTQPTEKRQTAADSVLQAVCVKTQEWLAHEKEKSGQEPTRLLVSQGTI